MKKIIRIQAKCDLFEIDEQIEESKAEKRLLNIQSFFLHNKTMKFAGKKRYINSDKLQVTTSVVNPTLL